MEGDDNLKKMEGDNLKKMEGDGNLKKMEEDNDDHKRKRKKKNSESAKRESHKKKKSFDSGRDDITQLKHDAGAFLARATSDNLVTIRAIDKKKDIYTLVASTNISNPDTVLFRLDDGINKNPTDDDVFYHRFKKRDRGVFSKPIGRFLKRVYADSNFNAQFNIFENRVDVVSTKAIARGDPIEVYAGKSINDRWVDGVWRDVDEITKENARLVENLEAITAYDVVAATDIKVGEKIFRYEKDFRTESQYVSGTWDVLFHMDYFYHVFKGEGRIANPNRIGVHLSKEFDESKSNAKYTVYQDRVEIFATKPIREGHRIIVYSGPGVNYRWVGDGKWEYYYCTRGKNLYTDKTLRVVYGRHRMIKHGCEDLLCYDNKCICSQYDTVCETGLCKCKAAVCKNRPFDKPFSKTSVKSSAVDGSGLFAEENINLGKWIIEYVGEVVDVMEHEHRSQYYATNNSNFVARSNKYNFIVDSTRSGNVARFINHSCDPNATAKHIIDDKGLVRILIKAKNHIRTGAEIFLDYEEVVDFANESIECQCKTKRCRKNIKRSLTKPDKKNPRPSPLILDNLGNEDPSSPLAEKTGSLTGDERMTGKTNPLEKGSKKRKSKNKQKEPTTGEFKKHKTKDKTLKGPSSDVEPGVLLHSAKLEENQFVDRGTGKTEDSDDEETKEMIRTLLDDIPEKTPEKIITHNRFTALDENDGLPKKVPLDDKNSLPTENREATVIKSPVDLLVSDESKSLPSGPQSDESKSLPSGPPSDKSKSLPSGSPSDESIVTVKVASGPPSESTLTMKTPLSGLATGSRNQENNNGGNVPTTQPLDSKENLINAPQNVDPPLLVRFYAKDRFASNKFAEDRLHSRTAPYTKTRPIYSKEGDEEVLKKLLRESKPGESDMDEKGSDYPLYDNQDTIQTIYPPSTTQTLSQTTTKSLDTLVEKTEIKTPTISSTTPRLTSPETASKSDPLTRITSELLHKETDDDTQATDLENMIPDALQQTDAMDSFNYNTPEEEQSHHRPEKKSAENIHGDDISGSHQEHANVHQNKSEEEHSRRRSAPYPKIKPVQIKKDDESVLNNVFHEMKDKGSTSDSITQISNTSAEFHNIVSEKKSPEIIHEDDRNISCSLYSSEYRPVPYPKAKPARSKDDDETVLKNVLRKSLPIDTAMNEKGFTSAGVTNSDSIMRIPTNISTRSVEFENMDSKDNLAGTIYQSRQLGDLNNTIDWDDQENFVDSEDMFRHHTTAMKGHIMYPHKPPSSAPQGTVKGAVINSSRDPGTTDMQHYAQVANTMCNLGEAFKKDADAYKVISDSQNDTMKIHMEGQTNAARLDLDRQKIKTDVELSREKINLDRLKMQFDHTLAEQKLYRDRMEHERQMAQLNYQAKNQEMQQANQIQQAEKSRIECNIKLLELDQFKQRLISGKKYAFIFTREGGARLIPSNEPCNPEDRQRFDEIWSINDNLLAIDRKWEEYARKMTGLNVIANPIEFKWYIDKLVKKTPWSGESILRKRLTLLTTINKDSGVYLFQTGPSSNYSFYDWAGVKSPTSPERMLGNARYVVHSANGLLYAADLWEPILYTHRFPVDMPYMSENFNVNQGIDSRGVVYNEVTTPPRGTAQPFMSVPTTERSPELEISDIKTVWFEIPRANDKALDKYYQLDDAMRRTTYPDGVMSLLTAVDGGDHISVFVAVYALVRYHDCKDELDSAGAIVLDVTNGQFSEQSYRSALATYGVIFPNNTIYNEHIDKVEYILLKYPDKSQERVRMAAAEEIVVMRQVFEGNEVAIETAVQIYGMYLSRYIMEDFTADDVSKLLNYVNQINIRFDTKVLPVLASQMKKIATYTFRFLGFKVEDRGDILLRRLSNFQKVFMTRISVVYPPLKKLLLNHGYIQYITALHRQMGLEGLPFEQQYITEDTSTYVDPLAPVSYSLQTALNDIENDDHAITTLQNIIFDEISVVLEDIQFKLDAGEIIDPAALFRINKHKESIFRLEKNKRDVLLQKLSVLEGLSTSPAIYKISQTILARKDTVRDRCKNISADLVKINDQKKALIDDLLQKPPSIPVVPPPRIHEEMHMQPSVAPIQQPQMHMQPPETPTQPMAMHVQPLETPTQPPETPTQPMGMHVQPPEMPETHSGAHMQPPNRPPPAYNDQSALDAKMLIRAMSGPPIQYRPIGEIWRLGAIRRIFGKNPAKYPRKNYAIGFSPLHITQPGQKRFVQRARGDGNCFYHALALVIFGEESDSLQMAIRYKLGTEVNRLKAYLDQILLDPIGSGKGIFQDRFWADEYVLMVASIIINVKIYTHIKESGSTGWGHPPMLDYSKPHPITGCDWPEEAIYIDHVGRTHFNPVHIGIKESSDIVISHKTTGRPRFVNLPVPSLTPNKTAYIDGELARMILTTSLVDKSLFHSKMNEQRNINSTKMATFKRPFIKYFYEYTDENAAFRTLTFTRVALSTSPQWELAIHNTILIDAQVVMTTRDRNTNRIQDDRRPNVLMVDFANKYVGGGTLGNGAVQEELLFLTYPELILSKLLMPDAMRDNEALVMTGAIRMSDYTYNSKKVVPKQYLEYTEGNFVAIDALNFSDHPERQYNKQAIDRELTKAYVGFNQQGYDYIRTGNWGSGAFRGDNRLKLIIQLLACIVANKKMIYCCFEENDKKRLEPVLRYCNDKTVAGVYNKISKITSKADLDAILR